jgi:hypothetical protein
MIDHGTHVWPIGDYDKTDLKLFCNPENLVLFQVETLEMFLKKICSLDLYHYSKGKTVVPSNEIISELSSEIDDKIEALAKQKTTLLEANEKLTKRKKTVFPTRSKTEME